LRRYHADLAEQAVFQGIVVTIVSLVFYIRSVAVLGASGGAAFGALVPAFTAFIAIPLLRERPSDIGWVAIVLISAGVYLASGGPLPIQRASQNSFAFRSFFGGANDVNSHRCGWHRMVAGFDV
jgi:hypothetical protein